MLNSNFSIQIQKTIHSLNFRGVKHVARRPNLAHEKFSYDPRDDIEKENFYVCKTYFKKRIFSYLLNIFLLSENHGPQFPFDFVTAALK